MIKRMQQHLLALFYLLTNAGYRLIKKSGIFDSAYYLTANPDVAIAGNHPLVHYFREGWKEGRSPNVLFDISFYFKQAPEIKGGTVEPILHFISEGWQQGRKPGPFFDPLYYAVKTTEVDFSRCNPLSHFIRQGLKNGQNVPPYIDLQFYQRKYPDVSESTLDPLIHYITIGRKEHRQPSVFFDVSWYLDRTPVLQEVAENILAHYALYGVVEGKSPLPVFDPAYYQATFPDMINRKLDLLSHYVSEGEVLGLRPCAWFDPVYYKQTYLNDSSSSALAHYLSEGVYRGLYANGDVAALPEKPVISLLVPVFNVAAHHLNNCIRSVLYQSYPHWQLCLADDGSTAPHVKPLLKEWAAKDSRIKVDFIDSNVGISGATNAAAALADGQYFGFLDNDDELAPECLFNIANTIAATGADLLYTDEDLIGEDGRRFSVFYKPDFNPELLLCHNYVTHFVVTADNLFHAVDGFALDRAGAQDYDLFLKLSEQAETIVHIPEVLYRWRASETSTSINHEQKQYAEEAGRLSVADAMQRRAVDAVVQPTDLKFFYRTQREQYLLPLVSMVMYWEQHSDDPTTWLQNLISMTAYKNFEVILLHNEEASVESLRSYAMQADQPIRLVEVNARYGIAAHYNLALQHCDGEYVAFISSFVIIEADTWLSTLLEYCQTPSTGAVCGRVDQENAGVGELTPLPDIENQSARYYARYLQQASILLNGLQCPQNIWCVGSECCVVKKEVLDNCGGFAAEEFPDLFSFHDLSFRLLDKDLQIYYTPYCRVECRVEAGKTASAEPVESLTSEKILFQEKWRQKLLQGDPFFNRGKLQEAHISPSDFNDWFAGGKQG